MAKVEITIRCVKCNQVEKVVTNAWATVKTTCGCNAPYRVLERRPLPDEPAPPKAPADEPKQSAG